MPLPSPRNAPEASRLIRCTEAAAKLDVAVYSAYGGQMKFVLVSFKTEPDGQRTNKRYVIDMLAYTCTCPDFQERGGFCKHLIYMEAQCREAAESIEADFQARQAEAQEDGRLYMANLHAERSLSC